MNKRKIRQSQSVIAAGIGALSLLLLPAALLAQAPVMPDPPQNVRAATVPGAPRVVVAEPGEKQLSVAWEGPASDGGAAITTYILRWKPESSATYAPDDTAAIAATFESIGGVTDGNYDITGLVSGRLYTVGVAAVNAIGVGAYAMTSAAPTLGAPRNLRATAAGSCELRLDWESPQLENAARLTGYGIKWEAVPDYMNDPLKKLAFKLLKHLIGAGPADRGSASVGAAATSYTISALRSGVTYEVKVAAWNDSVKGEDAGAFAAPNSPLPCAPREVELSAEIYTLHAKWDAPAAAEAVRSYHLRTETGAEMPVTRIIPAANSYTITGLQPAATYSVQVAAENPAGLGEFSPAVTATTKHLVFNLDVNEDGAENAHDGILIARYLLGVRGPALIDGQTDNSAETIEKIIAEGIKDGRLNVITDGEEPQWQDGIEVAKFLLGIEPDDPEVAKKLRELLKK